MADTDPARLIDVIAGFQAADARMDVHAGRLSALEADFPEDTVIPNFAELFNNAVEE